MHSKYLKKWLVATPENRDNYLPTNRDPSHGFGSGRISKNLGIASSLWKRPYVKTVGVDKSASILVGTT